MGVGGGAAGLSGDVLKHILSLDSRDFRLILGDPFLEDLEQSAALEGRSFSNTCLQIFLEKGGHNGNHHPSAFGAQMQLFIGPAPDEVPTDRQSSQLGVTFRESKHQGPHGWYPYVEGFSATYVRDALLRFDRMPRAVYDALRAYADIWATRGVRAWEERWWMLAAEVGSMTDMGECVNAR